MAGLLIALASRDYQEADGDSATQDACKMARVLSRDQMSGGFAHQETQPLVGRPRLAASPPFARNTVSSSRWRKLADPDRRIRIQVIN